MRDKIHSFGVVLTIFGSAGIAEYITSGRGSFIFSAIVFSIGYSCVLSWWIRPYKEKENDKNMYVQFKHSTRIGRY